MSGGSPGDPAEGFRLDPSGGMRRLVQQAAAALEAGGVANFWTDARRLAEWAAGANATQMLVAGDEFADDPAFRARFEAAVRRRLAREPLQYLEGSAAFLDFEVVVGPGVLVPRPETEVVALCAIGLAGPDARILDCGTGTGVLAIALARARPDAEVHATERAAPALVWAARNIGELAPQVQLHEAWFFGVDGTFDLVVANPPYVDAHEWAVLEPEVRDWEPRTALVPTDGDGLHDLAQIIDVARGRIRPGGHLVCEIGATQGVDVVQLATEAGFVEVEVVLDLAGRDRVLVARQPAADVDGM